VKLTNLLSPKYKKAQFVFGGGLALPVNKEVLLLKTCRQKRGYMAYLEDRVSALEEEIEQLKNIIAEMSNGSVKFNKPKIATKQYENRQRPLPGKTTGSVAGMSLLDGADALLD